MIMTTSALGYAVEPPQPSPAPAPEVSANVQAETGDGLKIIAETENPDGSLTMAIDMPYEMLVHFARIGLNKVLEDAAAKALEEHGPVK